MKILVLGAGGMLGRAVVASTPRDSTVVPSTRADLDLTDTRRAGERLRAERADWVVNCAAWTNVDGAESDARNQSLNAEVPAAFARACAAAGSRLLHLSTDYVFDGTLARPYRENDATNPLGAYGRAKLAGERSIIEALDQSLIVRTQWLFGVGGRNFVSAMIGRADQRLPSRVVNDQRGAPTSTPALAEMIWRLIAADARGIVHATAAGEATWFEIAGLVYRLVLGAEDLVAPCTTAEFSAASRRPADGRLDLSRYKALTGHTPEHWRGPVESFWKMGAQETGGRGYTGSIPHPSDASDHGTRPDCPIDRR